MDPERRVDRARHGARNAGTATPAFVLLAVAAAVAVAAALALATAPASASASEEGAQAAAVLAADVAFARTSAARDLEAFAAQLADDAVFGGGADLLRGRDAIRRRWAPFFAPGGPSLTWAPRRAEVARSGDLAYTTGAYRLVSSRPGAPVAEGEYVTVWRRSGGRWRVALDLALVPAPADGPPLARARERLLASRAGDLEAEIGTWRSAAPGAPGVRRGDYLRVRRRAGERWTLVVDSAPPAGS